MKKLQIPEFAREHFLELMVVVIGGIIVALVVANLSSGGGGDGSTEVAHGPEWSTGEKSRVLFTVENDARSGVWALTSPVMEEFSDRTDPPVNAARWIPNLKEVIVICAREGTPYNVKVGDSYSEWRWYAELKDGNWFPMAGFQETTEDGAQHLRAC